MFKKYLILISVLLQFFTSAFSQINTPIGATHPFGTIINGDPTPYDYGIIPSNLPSGAYTPASSLYGKSQDAYLAYNTWKTNYAENCGGGKWRIKFDNAAQTVSEGIGYGMLISAYAADKTLFDGLWAYYKQNSNGNGLMNWQINGCSGAIGSNGATDADLDAAMALIVAECQWPTINSPYDYSTEATNLITSLKNNEIDGSSYQAINGDGWGFGSSCRNPSYQSPAYYRQFAAFVPAQATFWNNAVNGAYSLLNANRNTTTGLISNWSDASGNPGTCNGPLDHGYDACRNPWRMAVDVLWSGSTTAQNNFCTPMASYVNGKGAVANVGGPVTLAGANSGGYEHGATFVSMFAAGITGSSAAYQTSMDNMYTETVNVTDALPRYFGNTLRIISLFVMTGNFWKPCPPATPSTINISLTSPANGAVYYEGDNIPLTATATTTNGTITNVEFYANGVLLGADPSSPYSFNWNNVPSGSYSITAVGYNSASENASSAAINIQVIKAVRKTATIPALDATTNGLWTAPVASSLDMLLGGVDSSAADLSANYKALWDDANFYLLVQVTDKLKVNNGGTDVYNDDGVEVYFDINNDKSNTYGTNDGQFTFRWNDATVTEGHNHSVLNIAFTKKDNATGYVMAMKFPWTTLGYASPPPVNTLVGFDVQVNDDDDGGNRDAKIAWNATADEAWRNPSYMGTVILKDIASLPVNLIEFNASKQGNNAVVTWSTATEINNDYFAVERSYDQVNFEKVGVVAGKGNTNVLNHYSWEEPLGRSSVVYYRLKQYDFDGGFTYSKVASINTIQELKFIVSPNPFDDEIKVELSNENAEKILVKIIDIHGRELESVAYSSKEGYLKIGSSLGPGFYVLKIITDTESYNVRILKK